MTRSHHTRCLPLDPLAHLMGIQLGVIGGQQPGRPPTGLAAIAERLGISHTMAQDLRRHGLSPDQADRYAERIGYHPSNIWNDWWTDIETDPGFYDTAGRPDIAGDGLIVIREDNNW